MDFNPLVVVSKSILDGASPQIGQALGDIAENVIMAVFGNRATRWRVENLASESQKCIDTLRKRGFTSTEQLRELLPKFGLLYVEQASLEDNETLQDVWANLLANALDPQRDFSGFHNAFMDMIRGLSPIDAQLLSHCFQCVLDYQKSRPHVILRDVVFLRRDVLSTMSISGLDYLIAVQNLIRLQILEYHEKPLEIDGEGHLIQHIPDSKEIRFTPFGFLFVENCFS